MSLLFLDIDGVLNSAAWLYASDRPEGMEFLGNEHLMVSNPAAVARLNLILSKSGAEVVISSSWRHGFDPGRMQDILDRAGFSGKVIGATPTWMGNGNVRGDEIQAWLDDNGGRGKATENYGWPDPFVILDDDADMAHLLPKLVHTTWAHGLLDEHVEAALGHLRP